MKTQKIIYYAATALFTLLMLFSAGMYIFNNEAIVEAFTKLGYPTYIIYPLAVAKILGLIAIWYRKINWLKEWAYAGFFFNLTLSLAAHFVINTDNHLNALLAMVFMLISYISQKYAFEYL